MPDPLVSMVVSTYLYGEDRDARVAGLSSVLASLHAQTFRDFDVLVVHNGPDPEAWCEYVVKRHPHYDDYQMDVWLAPEPKGCYGYPWRRQGAERCRGKYVGLASDDGVYATGYLERMVTALEGVPADFAYCDMIHSHLGWQQIHSRPEVNYIDVGNWVALRSMVAGTEWRDFSNLGDGRFVSDLFAKHRPRYVKVPGILYTKN